MAQSVYNVFGGSPILTEEDAPAQRNSFAQYQEIERLGTFTENSRPPLVGLTTGPIPGCFLSRLKYGDQGKPSTFILGTESMMKEGMASSFIEPMQALRVRDLPGKLGI